MFARLKRSVEAARAPGGLLFLLLSWCVYTLHRGIYSVQEKNNSVNSPSAPTASISSHSHSQSVLNVSRAPSLALCLAVCLPLPVSGLDNSNVFAAAALQQLTLFPDSEIVPRLCVLLHAGGDAVRGGLGDVVLLFSHSVQIEKCLSWSHRKQWWK